MPNDDTDTLAVQKVDAASRVRQQVEDALELSRFVIETGVTDADGQPLAFADIETIQNTAATLGIIQIDSGAAAQTLGKADWAAFEQAYYRLAIATAPVTAETLRNTRYVAGAGGKAAGEGIFTLSSIVNLIRGYSPAQTFTRSLWLVTILVALLAMVAEWRINALGMKADAESVKVSKDLWQWVQPWAYGALGSCAYLLRSGHYYIYARSFDLRRKPEYFNRILLGAISGGAIILFMDYLSSQDDSMTHIGSTALGFVAGYSTDFLFNTIQRIVTAIFPKVDVETVVQDKPKKPPKKPQNGSNNNGGASGAGTGTVAGDGS
jgi:hypothetical protein